MLNETIKAAGLILLMIVVLALFTNPNTDLPLLTGTGQNNEGGISHE